MSNITCYDSDNNLLKMLYQWDNNQTMTIKGVDMPPIPVFHFCNRLSNLALIVSPTVSGSDLTVKIPNILLQQAEPIIAYLYQDTDDDGYRTMHTIHIPVVPRPKPDDYEYNDNIDYISVDVLNSRLTALLSTLTDGSASDAAPEVIDIRIGYDGTVYDTAGDAVRALGEDLTLMKEELERYIDAKAVDGVYYENNLLYLTSNGEIVSDPVEILGGGGGGGGSSNEYTITLTNLLPSRLLTVADGTSVALQFSYASIDSEGVDDGTGIGSIVVNNVTKGTIAVQQGNNTVDVTDYLTASTNTVKVRVTNSEGSMKTLSYTISVVSLSISTTFAEMASYSSNVVFSYTPSGAGEKTIHFVMDGTEIDTAIVTSNNRSQSFKIPEQAHGAHIFKCFATMTVDGVSVQSNVLTLGMMWIDETSNVPIVLSPFAVVEATQGENLTIPYMVYDPSTETASVTRKVLNPDNSVYSQNTVTVGRTAQSWSVNDYPAGEVNFVISCGTASVTLPVTVSESALVIEPVTDALALEFSAAGRSNSEETPDSWGYEGISASFEGFGWTGADGWVDDADGNTVLRFLPNDFMSIPLKPFESDARTTGFTVEAEFATRDVQDYDSIVFSSFSGGRGFRIGSQYAELKSEQSEVSMQFKEDSRVRVCFVVENRNLNRLVYIYINGVMCGVSQYPTNDDFSQASPVGLTIGAESCGIDLYRIRIYGKGLTRNEQLDNFIYDRPTLVQREAAYHRNDVLNESEELVVTKLPATLPYMIIECAELPQYKGDKKTGVKVTYVNPADPSKSFTATGAEIDVQGTSSAGYTVKNYKVKLKGGIVYIQSGKDASKYPLRDASIPVSTFCLKADFASSENANNVKLVDFYETLCPYKTPPQQADSRVRQGIDGLPMVVFWQDASGNVSFVGKYNFNNDKSTGEVFGFTSSYPNAESWEFKNNTSNRCLLKASDYTGDDWLNDFEARYPEDNTSYAQLKRVTDWLVLTDRDAVSSESDKEARLTKFKNEFETYFVKSATLFYYLFTECFLMIDNRAKNMFMTTYDGVHWLPLPYDFDTAIGINNEGVLVFDYDLEDTDRVGGANVFNGQTSVLWNNVRDAFGDEIAEMYRTMRSAGTFSYTTIKEMFQQHQSVWSEAVWNEDAFVKYLQPYLVRGENYLSMLQGSKESQRDWWLFNAFKYRDSKYQAGDALSTFITLRCYALGDITVTPYSHIWPTVKYGSYVVRKRGKRNIAYTLDNPMDQMNDTEVYIYSADRVKDVGDLSVLQVGYANFSMATKLQSLKLGSSDDGYNNTNLKELYVGNNELLKEIDIQNCTALGTDAQKSIDLSGCSSLETVYAKGTAISGIELPDGGHLKALQLPATITNFTVLNQKSLNELTFEGVSALTTLRIENTPNVDVGNIVNSATNLSRVRLINVEWEAASQSDLQTTITKLKSCIGMDAEGNNTQAAVVTGVVSVPSISSDLLTEINEAFPELVVIANGAAQYIVRFLNFDNSVLYRQVVAEGGSAANPVTEGHISAPTRPGNEDTGYSFRDFGDLPTDVHSNLAVYAVYDIAYRVQFMVDTTVYDTQWVVSGGSATTPASNPTKASTAQYTYTFKQWDKSYTNITAPLTINAVFTSTVRRYTVTFYNGSTKLLEVPNVPYGGSANYTGDTPVKTDVNDPDNYEFIGWQPVPTNITGSTSCYAQFRNNGFPTATTADGAYGVEWDYSNSSPLLTRVGLAVGLSSPAPATSVSGSGFSPFDNIMPWAGMKRYNVIDGEISYSEDDPCFSQTDYDTVVYIPPFYYTAYKDTESQKWLWAISPTEKEGYMKHPGSGRYVGRYHTSGSSSSLFTKSGVRYLEYLPQSRFRAYSRNKGAHWGMLDLATWSAIQMLYLIEFANWDIQTTLGYGRRVDSTVMGGTDSAVYHTLYSATSDNQYRWIEDPACYCQDWIDGCVGSTTQVYAAVSDIGYSSGTQGLQPLGFGLPSSGNIQGFGYSTEAPWAFMPDVASGSDYTTFVCDRVTSSSSLYPAYVGGGSGGYASYGLFSLVCNTDASSNRRSNVGSRLIYIP